MTPDDTQLPQITWRRTRTSEEPDRATLDFLRSLPRPKPPTFAIEVGGTFGPRGEVKMQINKAFSGRLHPTGAHQTTPKIHLRGEVARPTGRVWVALEKVKPVVPIVRLIAPSVRPVIAAIQNRMKRRPGRDPKFADLPALLAFFEPYFARSPEGRLSQREFVKAHFNVTGSQDIKNYENTVTSWLRDRYLKRWDLSWEDLQALIHSERIVRDSLGLSKQEESRMIGS